MTIAAKKLLWDIHQSAEAIAQFVKGQTFATYDADLLIRSAVERQFEIMGEAARRLRDEDRVLFDRMPELAGVIAFRNFLAHVYDKIDNAKVWDIIVRDLPKLTAQTRTHLT